MRRLPERLLSARTRPDRVSRWRLRVSVHPRVDASEHRAAYGEAIRCGHRGETAQVRTSNLFARAASAGLRAAGFVAAFATPAAAGPDCDQPVPPPICDGPV